jgi:hypothetical protein
MVPFFDTLIASHNETSTPDSRDKSNSSVSKFNKTISKTMFEVETRQKITHNSRYH